MHIVFLSHYFPPEVNAPASRTFEHCRRWVDAGHQVTVVTCAPNCPTGIVFDGYKNAWRSEETQSGIRVIRVWSFLSANKGFLGRILNFVSYMMTATWAALWLKKVDVAVATSPQFFCGWAGVLCHWICRWPFVLEIRDIWPESIVAVGAMKKSMTIRMLEWLELRMYAAADYIVTVGNGYREQLLERKVPADKIAVIPNGVELQKFQPRSGDAEFRAKWNGADKFVCAYIGTIGMAHGLEVVLKAAEQLRDGGRSDVQFWIVGDGAERATLEARATELKLSNITFTGMIAKDQVDAVLASCDACLVHLRGTELFGTVIPSKVFETMAMNVPIIMGVRGQAQDIVMAGGGGVAMTPDDPQSLLDGIKTISADPTRYHHGRGHVTQNFDRGLLAIRMLTVLEAVAAGRKPREITLPAEDRKAA
jgi:glycosyltransferase involved in cell wall biosynthesis